MLEILIHNISIKLYIKQNKNMRHISGKGKTRCLKNNKNKLSCEQTYLRLNELICLSEYVFM